MVALLTRRPQTAPVGLVSIDYGHPLAQGLILCAWMGRDLTTGMPMAQFAGRPVPSAAGIGWTWDLQAGTGTGAGILPRVTTWSAYTLMSTMSAASAPNPGASGTDCYLLDVDKDAAGPTRATGATRILQHRIAESDTGIYAGSHYAVSHHATGLVQHLNTTSVCDGRPHVVGIVGANGRYEQWRDGQLVVLDTTAQTPLSAAGIYVAQNHYDTVVSPLTVMWNRALSWGELQWFSTEPYAFLTSAARTRFGRRASAVTFRPQVLVIG